MQSSRDFPTAWAGKADIDKLMVVFEHCDDEGLILIGPRRARDGGAAATLRAGPRGRQRRLDDPQRAAHHRHAIAEFRPDRRKEPRMRIARRINTSASEDRLSRLIEDRMRAGADTALIDRRIWDLFGETWCVMFTDLVGFSRTVETYGITHFLQSIYVAETELVPLIDEHDGILLKSEGDSMLVIFRNPNKALTCAVEMQRHLHRFNVRTPEADDVLLCVGLGYGHLLKIGDADVFGAQVNAASKLGEDTAKAQEILVTDSFKDALVDARVGFEPLDVVPPGAKASFKVLYQLD